jgi:hypothetical protein
MGKTRNTGFSNNAIQYNSGSIAFVNGATTLLNISSSGNIVTTGTITANTLVIQTVTSSVSFVTGSTQFGSISANTHQFTGSMFVTGGINLNSGSLLVGTNSPVWSNGTTRGHVEVNGPTQAIYGMSVGGSGAGYLYHDGTNMSLVNGVNGYLRFSTNSAEVIRIAGSSMGIGTTNISTEANLYLGAQGASEGGQLVLQKGTSYASASHIDNYQDRLRIMRGNDTGSTAELMTVNMATGNVGIGIATPTPVGNGYTTVGINGVNGAGLTFNINGASANSYIYTATDGFNFVNVSGNYLFYNTGTERMRINSEGKLLIGKTSDDTYRLQVEAAAGGNQISLTRSGANAGMFMGGVTGAATTFYIQANGSGGVYLTSGATSWTGNSDERLKNITGNIENAIDSLLTLRTVKHTWKSDDANKEHLTLIAQDVEAVFPQVIDKSKINEKDGDETEYLGVRYTELIPVLVKAIQELKAENDALKTRIETLENK